MKYAVLVGKGLMNGTCNGWKNIGDYVQSLAAAQYLPQVDEFVDRENACPVGEDIKMIMNAWYMWNPERFPIYKRINPLLVSIHISPMIKDRLFTNPEILKWLKKYEPIGCRDTGTVDLLKLYGIDSYFSGCLTLTLGKKYKFNGEREGFIFVDPYLPALRKELSFGDIIKVFIFSFLHLKSLRIVSRKINHHYCVGRFIKAKKIVYSAILLKIYSRFFTMKDLQEANFVSHMIKVGDNTPLQSEEDKMHYAEKLVKKYAAAKLVVTGRIHCALPCLGLETPVVFTVGYTLEEGSHSSSAGRFGGLMDFFNVVRIKKLKACGDINFPLKNKKIYKSYAEKLEKKCEDFIND